MVGRLIIGAVTWLVALLVLATALQRPASTRLSLLDHPPTSSLARSLNGSTVAAQRRSWAVTGATTASRVMMVDVVAVRADQAVAIARALIEPVRGEYEEVLIYVRAASIPAGHASRRVQWTERGGYIETLFETEP